VIHLGGAGTASAALAAGRPQVLVPTHLEHYTTGHMLQAQGIGVSLSGTVSPESAREILKQVLADDRFTASAQAVARRLHERPRRPALPAILAACRRMLSGS
jgi:UDP:flavonoid glycosyltransferase YjiC (YdhE family)